MNTAIHPKYFEAAKARCACGHTMTIGSTQEEILVELCSACHPFFTGKQKLIDTEGRVDKFKKRAEKKTAVASIRKGKKAKKEKATARKQQKEK